MADIGGMRRRQHAVDAAAEWREIEHIKVAMGIDQHDSYRVTDQRQ
jgi:hypothetical protein